MKKITYIVLAAFLFASCKSDDDTTTPVPEQEVVTVNVDVILPLVQQEEWQQIIGDALTNIDRAQQSCRKRVKLNLRYHDEDTEDLEKLAYALTRPGKGDAPYLQPDTCHAIIGPYHSANARKILDQAQRSRLPVIMPTCTSAELQRSEARQTNSFFLTESDITQCEVLLTMMKEFGHRRVALLYTDDTYGQSFRDWFGFLAAQTGLDVIPGGIQAYAEGDDLSDFFKLFALSNTANEMPGVILALGHSELYAKVLAASERYYENISHPYFYVSDMGMTSDVLAYHVTGTYPVGSDANGFMQGYYGRYGKNPPYGAAQIYDALSIIALGRAAQLAATNPDELYIKGERVEYETSPKGPVLSDWIRALLAENDVEGNLNSPVTQWDGYGLAASFSLIEGGILPSLRGATGELNFDPHSYTTILNTTYLVWKSNNGVVVPVANISTNGYDNSISTHSMWEWQALIDDIENNDVVEHNLPPLGERWAIVISPSTTWSNYRHQADAFAMYQTLRHHGYDDDHIVLIVEDNLAYDSRNSFPGEIFVERNNTSNELISGNMRKDAVVDYHFSDLLGPGDLSDIIQGVVSERLPHVIHATEADNIFLFWSGHGADNGGPLWGNEDCRQPFGAWRIKNIIEHLLYPRRYRRMMLAIETCYSGQWGEALKGLPDVLVLSAANAYETSKPDEYDAELKTYLSNAFARSFRTTVTETPNVSLRDLYYSLARTTSGSHVTLYNIDNYGSVYQNTMTDYIGSFTP